MAGMELAIVVGGRNDLVKRFAAADKTQVSASAFLGGLEAVFEIDDLGVESRIAFEELLVQQTLLGNRGSQTGRLAIAAISKPKLGLQ